MDEDDHGSANNVPRRVARFYLALLIAVLAVLALLFGFVWFFSHALREMN